MINEIDFSDPIQALEFTARHWKWLSQNPSMPKALFPDLFLITPLPRYLCGLCEENERNSSGDCDKCLLHDFWISNLPIDSPPLTSLKMKAVCERSVYGRWANCLRSVYCEKISPEKRSRREERAYIALMISEAAQEKANELKKEKK